MLTIAFFNPVLKGYVLNQGDIRNWEGVAKETLDHREATGDNALWTNSLFGGMPTYLISIKYTGNLFNYLHKVFAGGIQAPMGYIFICMLGFYFLMLVLRINPWIGMIGAFAFAFSTYFIIIIEAGHNTKLQAIAYMAPLLGAIIMTFRGKYLLGGALAGALVALEISCNHLQITYYLFMLIAVYGVFKLIEAVKEKQLPQFGKAIAVLGIAAVLGLGANVNRLWSLYEYSKYSTRGKSELKSNQEDKTSGLDKSYATAWSYGIGETWTLLIPNYKGGGSGAIMIDDEDALKDVDPQMKQLVGQLSPYFGDQPFTSGPVYVGAIICFLFILGLFVVEKNLRWVMLVGTILSVMLAWGKNFMGLTDFFLDYVPGYNKFRTVSMTLVIAELTMPVLAFVALDRIIRGFSKEKMKYVYISFALTGGMSLVLWLMGQSTYTGAADEALPGRLMQAGIPQNMIAGVMAQLEVAREAIFKADALRSFGLVLGAFVLVYLFVKNTIKKEILIAGIAVLVLGDMWTVNRRYITTDKQGGSYAQWVKKKKQQTAYTPDAADNSILQDPDPDFRVFNTTARLDQDSRTSYFHKSLGGYHGAKMKRYQELIDHHLGKGNQNVINMLNTKYFIVGGEQGGRTVQQNPGALGHAWLVNKVKFVPDADAEINALEDFDPAAEAVVDERFKDMVKTTSPAGGSIKLRSYKPGEWVYEAQADGEALAVFSEIYYPEGMKVTVDGSPADHFRVDYVLRGMMVPKGKHEIRFSFEPSSYYVGEKVSLASSLALILLLGFAVYKNIKEDDKPEEEPEA